MSRLRRLREWIVPPLPEAEPTTPTLDEVRRQVRHIEIRARRALRDAIAGEYRTAFRGRGLEFAELQPYNPGDDVRSIDWKATARLRTPVVRRYVEEREQTVLILVDVSGSMSYAASGPSIHDRAVEITGVLGLAAAAAKRRRRCRRIRDRRAARSSPGQGIEPRPPHPPRICSP